MAADPDIAGRREGDGPLRAAILACVLIVCFVILAHLAALFWLSLADGSPGATALTYGWRNYAEVFSDSRTVDVLWNTAGFATLSLLVALGFGLPAAWLAERTDLPGKTFLFTMMTIGMLIPGFSAAMGWLFLLHPRIGIVNTWLVGGFGLRQPPFNIASVGGMAWVQGLNMAPLAFIMTAAVFRALDPALEEAAQMSGAGPATTIRRVALPLAWPGVLAAAIYVFTIGFAAFDIPAIIGWSNRIFTFSTYVYLLLSPQDVLPRYGVAAALSVVVVAIAAALSWWYGAMQERSRRFAVITGKAYRPALSRLGGKVWPAWLFLGFYFLMAKILPILLLVWSSLLPFFQPPSLRALSFVSTKHYASLPWDLALTGARNTAVLMILTPTLALAVATGFSWTLLRTGNPFRKFFDFVAFLPHAIPSVVFGVAALLIALYVLQNMAPIYGTIWLLLLVFFIARLSYATRMTNSALIQIHPELEESARMSGAGLGQVLSRVLAPLLSPTLIYAWLWIALLVFRELTLAVILSSGGNVTLPVVIWSLWLGGGLGQASALAVAMLAVMAPIMALYWIVARRRGFMAST